MPPSQTWAASGLADAGAAVRLAELWAAAVAGGVDYRWRGPSGDWVCDAEWSTRSPKRPATEMQLVNRLIAAATGTD
jgi:hypothetical protein